MRRAFRLEDLFANNPSDPAPSFGDEPGADMRPGAEVDAPVSAPPVDVVPESPMMEDMLDPPPGMGGMDSGPLPPPGFDPGPDPLPPGPENAPIPPASPTSPVPPTSATAPGSFANPGSSAARPLQPFNYRSLFDSRNASQGPLSPGSRVPSTPANIAPAGPATGGQSESAITRSLRRLRG